MSPIGIFFDRKQQCNDNAPLPLGRVCICLEARHLGEGKWQVVAAPKEEPEKKATVLIKGTPWPYFTPISWDGLIMKVISAM